MGLAQRQFIRKKSLWFNGVYAFSSMMCIQILHGYPSQLRKPSVAPVSVPLKLKNKARLEFFFIDDYAYKTKDMQKKITSSKALDATGFISTEAMHLKSRIRCSARFINSCLENRHKDKEINVTLTNGKNNLKMAWYPKKIVCTCLSNYTYIMEIYFSKYLSLFECTWLFVYSICDTKVWLI